MTCTFFGHKDTPQEIRPKLRSLLIYLIETKGVDTFYVGNHGSFDAMTRSTLRSLQEDYPHIKYAVVLAYLPSQKSEFSSEDYSDTIFPDGLEKTLPKYAILKRNRWLLDHADLVIAYVRYPLGGAAQFKELAEKQGKQVINLAAKFDQP